MTLETDKYAVLVVGKLPQMTKHSVYQLNRQFFR